MAAWLLGLATTIGVAWVCAVALDPQGGSATTDMVEVCGSGGDAWRLERYARGSFVRCTWYLERGKAAWNRAGVDPSAIVPAWSVAPERDAARAAAAEAAGLPMGVVFEDGAGWPFIAMRARSVMGTGSAFDPGSTGIVVPARSAATLVARIRVLPLEPIWPGFALNALLASGAWLVVFAALLVIRRACRRGVNACVRCGFDLRAGNVVCPECGRPNEAAGPQTALASGTSAASTDRARRSSR